MSAAGRTALVTGASSGIGRAIAVRLLDDDWGVYGVDRAPPTLEHPNFISARIDLSDPNEIATALGRAPAARALIHAAGHMRTGELGELDIEDGRGMWSVHVAAATALANAFAPRMDPGGRIVLIGSRAAAGVAGRSQYAAAKAALVALARSWAIELASRGITVNVISPAATETPLLRDPARAQSPPKTPPIGRFVQPQEVAALASFLLSEEAAAITGQNIVVCGGSSLI